MIVDDDEDTREVLSHLLTQAGFQPWPVESGRECLRVVDKVNPAVIVLDLMMPEVDGFEVCRALKANSKTSHIPIVVLTARDDFEARSQAMRVGVSDFIVKPASKDRLIARLTEQIQLAEALERAEASLKRLKKGS